MSSENYIENHDIRPQMYKLKSMDKYIPCENKLSQMTSRLNSCK